MRKFYLILSLLSISICCSVIQSNAQASACPSVNAGTDQTICQGACANLNATIQGTLATTSYAVSNIAYSPYSYVAGTTVLVAIDDIWTPVIPLPFCFEFFGTSYTSIVIGSNGLVSFNLAYANAFCPWSITAGIPSAANPINSIMAPFHDIDPSIGATSDVRYQTYGSYPCREFVISWSNTPMFSAGCNGNAALNATQQIVLHEATNIIDIYIQNKQVCAGWNGGAAIEGIQNAAGTVAYVVPGRNYPTQWTAVNDGYRFMPNGAPNYTIQWLDPAMTPIAATQATVVCPVVSGTYTAVLTNNTCSGPIIVQDQMNVTVSPITVTAGNGGPYCPGQTINLTATAGGTDYDWVGPSGYNQPNTQNPNIPGATPAMAGVYTVTMTNAAGCTATSTTTVVVGAVGATANNTGPYCEGATINLTSGAGGIDYDWVGPAGYNQPNTQNPTIPGSTTAMTGVYTVTVTYAGGCTATGTTSVTVNALPTPNATNTGPYCAGTTIQLNSPTGSATDDWVGPAGYVANNVQNPTIPGSTVGMTGVYTVTVTNAAGCSATATTSVTVNAAPAPTANNTGPYCAGATIQLNSPTGSGTDDWVGPAAYNQPNTQNPTIPGSTVGMSGVYTVTVTNAAGCSATATTSVTVNPMPVPVPNNTGPYCAGATIQLNSPGGSATDDWVGPGGYVANNVQNPTIPGATPAMSGVYTVTVTNAFGCSATGTTTVVVNVAGAAVANNTGPYCAGSTINLTSPAGPIDWDWVGPAGFVQNNTPNPNIPGSTVGMSGVYTVTTTMAGGCTATGTTTVTVNPLPTPTANNTGPYCSGSTIQLNSPTGSATDDWNGPLGQNKPNTQNPSLPLSTTGMTGTYTVTVTDVNGCSATATTSVVVNGPPAPVANNTGPYCTGATIFLSSPTGSATDDWTGPAGYTANNIQNPNIPGSNVGMSGVYTVTVTDINGCFATATTTVVVNALPTPTANNTGPYCVGTTIQLNSPTGSATDDWTGPAAYAQNNSQNPTIPGSTLAMNGVYTVSVTDANGCNATATTTVVVNALPTPTANNTGPYCSGSTIQLNSPTGSATDDWTGPAAYTQNDLQNPGIPLSTIGMTGTYTVTVTDVNGCSATATTSVVVNGPPAPVANNTGPYCEGVTIQLNSPTGSATDDWSGPAAYTINDVQNPTIPGSTVGMSGVYTVTVTDINGCFATATTTVVINALPTPTANNTGPYCEGTAIQLNSPTGSATDDWTGPAAYAQNNMQNPSIAGSTQAMNGVYTVSVTDANGCSATATTTVVINALPTPLFMGDNLAGCAPMCVNFTDQSVVAGSVITSWSWNVETQTPSNTQNVNYCFNSIGLYDASLTVTSAQGCSATLTIVDYINVTGSPVADFLYAPQEISILDPDVSFGNTSVGAVVYAWDFGDGNTSASVSPTHTYADTGVYCVNLIAINAFGCSDTVDHCLHVKPEFTLFVPNSFTVNEDGLNEVWTVYGLNIKSITVRIFDRWGEELYTFTDINKGWPGTKQNGNECKQDVYVYRIEVTDGNDDFHELMGQINLIR